MLNSYIVFFSIRKKAWYALKCLFTLHMHTCYMPRTVDPTSGHVPQSGHLSTPVFSVIHKRLEINFKSKLSIPQKNKNKKRAN